MRITAFLIGLFGSASVAQADVGHIGELLGHDHWVAASAIGIAIAVGLLGALKGRKAQEAAEGDVGKDSEPAAQDA